MREDHPHGGSTATRGVPALANWVLIRPCILDPLENGYKSFITGFEGFVFFFLKGIKFLWQLSNIYYLKISPPIRCDRSPPPHLWRRKISIFLVWKAWNSTCGSTWLGISTNEHKLRFFYVVSGRGTSRVSQVLEKNFDLEKRETRLLFQTFGHEISELVKYQTF